MRDCFTLEADSAMKRLMATSPTVSVIIPVYNGAPFLEETLESVLRQTYSRWEILVVDDGSTDESARVVERFAARTQGRTKLVTHPDGRNRGQFASRIEGARNARSELVALLDADDIWLPTYLERTVKSWEAVTCKYANLAFGFSSARYWFTDTRSRDFTQPMPPGAPRALSAGELAPVSIGSSYMISPCTSATILRKETLLRAAPFAELARGNLYEDQILWLTASAVAPVYVFGFDLMLYRQRPSSFSRGGEAGVRERAAKDELAMLNELYKALVSDARVPESFLRTIDARRQKVSSSGPAEGIRAIYYNSPRWLKRAVNRVRSRVRETIGARTVRPRVRMHRGVEPLSAVWGADRGTPIHRFYLEQFLKAYERDVRGRVLEFQNDEYATSLGGRAIQKLDIIHVDDTNPRATVIADLTQPNAIPNDSFDCIICTHVLHLIEDLPAAIRDLHRILAPGGALLVAVPQASMCDAEVYGELLRFTPEGLRRILARAFGADSVTVEAFGNSLVTAGELRGLVAEEFSADELAHNDSRFALEVCARAVKR